MTAAPIAPTEVLPVETEPRTFQARAMASPLRLTVAIAADMPGPAVDDTAAWEAVREEFEACEQAMSRFRDASEITVLNRRTDRDPPSPVSRRLRHALVAADRAQRLTDGRFDPRVLRDLERLGDRGAPLDDGPDSAHAARPDRRIALWTADGRIRLPEPVDLGGIGKGLALRWAARTVDRFSASGVSCWKPAATWSRAVRRPMVARGGSASRTRPAGRSRWPSSPRAARRWPRRRCAAATGSPGTGRSTT